MTKKTIKKKMTKYQRAMNIWSVLICAARERKSYTYEGLARYCRSRPFWDWKIS